MRKVSINMFAMWGALAGCFCMAAFLFYIDRARSVPTVGYIVEIFSGGIAGAGALSFLAWVNNRLARRSD